MLDAHLQFVFKRRSQDWLQTYRIFQYYVISLIMKTNTGWICDFDTFCLIIAT